MNIFLKTLILSAFCINCSHATTIPEIDTLSIEEKVGQMLIVHFNGEEANEEAKRFLEKIHFGGVIYYKWSNGLHNPAQVQQLSNGLQKLAKSSSPCIPLFIAVDQEGGRVTRLTTGFTQFPGNLAIAQTNHPEFVEASAFAIGQELKAVGINMNFAPVVDVNSNPLNPIIGARSFSSSPEEVALLGRLALQGYRKAGIIATLKHFPGHGDTSVDSHLDLPVVKKSIEELERTEFLPFKRLVKQADAIMTAHILLPSLDPQNCATLSKIVLEDLLRNQWGYEGVILSDSLVMQGILKNSSSIEEAALRAIQGGNDILILGGKALNGKESRELKFDDILRIHTRLVAAVQAGEISKDRLNASVKRILKLKNAYQLFKESYPDANDIVQYVNTTANQKLVKKINEVTMKS